ncbi:AAA domain protein [uncultured archaeon]|nr:AAA domain protein [uncultured archaeon]
MEERHRKILVKQNPWWQKKKIEVPGFERNLIKDLQKYMGYRQILGIVGLRRVGKTVLMKQIAGKLKTPENNICYISLDDIDFQKYEIAEDLINYFLEFSDKNKRRYLFLDEIQKLPDWADLLKNYYDMEENLKIFISGSASLEIREHKETLAGRLLTFHLPVLTFKEYVRYFGFEYEISENIIREYDLRFAAKKKRYEELFESYLMKGAFPELLEINDTEFINKYIKESVIEKSISDISKITDENEKTIYELFRLLVNSNAQLFEIINLAGILKTNRNLVAHYIDLLEKAFLIRVGYNFTASVSKQIRASKKQYCAHSSIVIALLDYPPEILYTEVAGHLVEAAIVNSIEKISFWRNPQHEVDIIIKKDSAIIPVEAKFKMQVDKKDIKSMKKFMEEFVVEQGFVVTRNMLGIEKTGDKEIMFIPAWLFLLTNYCL